METVLLTTSQLARRLGLASITLQIWRSQGIGIDAAPQPLANHPNGALGVGMSTPRPFPPKAIELITTQQAANRLGLSTEALHDLRCRDDSLPIVQKGFVVGYRLEDIQAFERREAVAMLDKVLATAHPLPMIRAIAKLVMSPPVDDMKTQQPLPTTAPAPEQSIPRVMHTPIATQAIKPETSLTLPAQYPSALSWYLIHTKPRQEAL